MHYKAAYSVNTLPVSRSTTSRETHWLKGGDRWPVTDPLRHSLVCSPDGVHDDESLMQAPAAWLLAYLGMRCPCGYLWMAGGSLDIAGENLPLNQ